MTKTISSFNGNIMPIPHLNVRCVYALINRGKIVYIGSSTNFAQRICAHIQKGEKAFDSYMFEEVPLNMKLENVEAELIVKYNPVLNKSLPMNDIYLGYARIRDTLFDGKSSRMHQFFRDHNIKEAANVNVYPYYLTSDIENGFELQRITDSLPF